VTTLVVSLSPAIARRVARAADALGVSHSEIGAIAVRLFCVEHARTHARANVAPGGGRGDVVRTRRGVRWRILGLGWITSTHKLTDRRVDGVGGERASVRELARRSTRIATYATVDQFIHGGDRFSEGSENSEKSRRARRRRGFLGTGPFFPQRQRRPGVPSPWSPSAAGDDG
jgi:hypothetical protein